MLRGFEPFVNLEVLWINGNNIKHLDSLDANFRMRAVFAHDNAIETLEGSSLKRFKFLNELHLNGNKLTGLDRCLKVLSKLQYLKTLNLYDNPVAEENMYRLRVIDAVPSLEVLDKRRVTQGERDTAKVQVRGHSQDERRWTRRCRHDGRARNKANPFSILSGCTKLLYEDVDRILAEREEEKAKAAAVKVRENSVGVDGDISKEDALPPMAWRFEHKSCYVGMSNGRPAPKPFVTSRNDVMRLSSYPVEDLWTNMQRNAQRAPAGMLRCS